MCFEVLNTSVCVIFGYMSLLSATVNCLGTGENMEINCVGLCLYTPYLWCKRVRTYLKPLRD